ncbi:xaa-Pro aminopeptidase 1-like [Phlebotomus argentipes]|uniref:xaa-Pro aminopeptidase 1-like n=1 Tax=Phlebotomus argentipes TaxID=94469 RepID=UPI0028931B16|nr:xaa-Pro aminopeptidase 1-like [Phlebotomus argentipes]
MRSVFAYGIGVLILAVVFIGAGFVVAKVITIDNVPSDEKEVSDILSEIRQVMRSSEYNVNAYLVTESDSYMGGRSGRVAYVSGFTGSNGFAIIADSKAAIWVDGRYHLQADNQVDTEYWEIMKIGVPGTKSHEEWLRDNLPSNARVGLDPNIFTPSEFNRYSSYLKTFGHDVVSISDNLVDLVWSDRPEITLSELEVQPLRFSGQEIADKLSVIRGDIESSNGEALVVSALDEIAWLLNLRGKDFARTPTFYAHVIITMNDLYVFFHENRNVPDNIKNHIRDESKTNCVFDYTYENFIAGLQKVVSETTKYILIPSGGNQATFEQIPAERRSVVSGYSPIARRKAVKNAVEAQGLRDCHVRDSVAVIRYLHWLNVTIGTETITEISGATVLEDFRSRQDYFKGLSFGSISGFGPNGAIVHYSPTEETDLEITTEGVYLIDSGGQYSDGTTDVTRTIHLGQPTEEEKLAYTLVLKGHLAIDRAIFPPSTPGSHFDGLARQFLFQEGMDYAHGTGHGIGAFIAVHEYPPSISSAAGSPGFVENMFVSNEPGYYEANSFGIRIESIVQVVKFEGKPGMRDFNGRGAYTFQVATMVPFQLRMINTDLITKEEAEQINAYHREVVETVGDLLRTQDQEAYNWLLLETEAIESTML